MRLPLRRVQRLLCVQQSVTCIFVSAERVGAARCRRPLIIGTLRPFFLSAQQEKQLFLQAMFRSASTLPTGHHAALSLQCNSRIVVLFSLIGFVCSATLVPLTARVAPSHFFFFCRAIARAPPTGRMLTLFLYFAYCTLLHCCKE
ncbi:hypothetical protein TcCL_ESM10939 [Trypanosoma cruzi]|nr:hypothetical protein TcCL_ESM10939 [Trypanosoma cruzi]